MGVYSHNVKSFFYSKPPLVVFLFCILSFSVTLLCLALYIQNNPSVKNTDVLDWNRLVQELGELKFCLCKKEEDCVCQKSIHTEVIVGRRKREIGVNLNKVDLSNSTKIFVTEKLPIKTRLLDELNLNTTFRGVAVVPLDHFGLGHDSSATVKVTLQQEQNHQDMVCVSVEGDKEHVQGLRNDTVGTDQCSSPEVSSTTHSLCVHSSSHIPHSWCSNGVRFDMDFAELPQYITYLTPQDRSLVHLHLMSTSAFLAALFLVSMGVAAVRGSRGARTLTSKHVGDSRGEMELISSTVDE